MFLDVLPYLWADGFLVVKVLDYAEEFGQVFIIVELLVELLELLNHIDKLSHNVGEDGDSEQQQHRSKNPLSVAFGAEISEAYCRERSEGKVDHSHCSLVWGVLLQIVVAKEVFGFQIFDKLLSKYQACLLSLLVLMNRVGRDELFHIPSCSGFCEVGSLTSDHCDQMVQSLLVVV